MPSATRVDLPPKSSPRPDGTLAGGWWHMAEDGRMVCDLCPRECHLRPGDRGFCFVRQNRDGEMVLTTYGRSTGFCIDPIEKKPLNHFYPGTSVLSFGTAGCNLGCKFCQNHDISKARKVELLSDIALPDAIAQAAVEHGCKSVAYTYNDPIIWAEYAIDTAKACRERDVKSVAVTAGYITPQARAPFFEFFDAANVDLKAFTEDFYEHVTLSHLEPVLETIEWLHRETDVWFEITNLVIPDANDSPDELRQLCDWVLKHVGDEVPVHFSAFHPDFRMLDRPRTPHEKLLEAHSIAKATGLKYVYVGNVHDATHQSTYCDACGEMVIERDWYQLGKYRLDQATCQHCGHQVPGRFEASPGNWGRKRQPVKIGDYATSANQDKTAPRQIAAKGTSVSGTSSQTTSGSMTPLSTEQESAILRAASELVAAAVNGKQPAQSDTTIGGMAGHPVHGVYVSLKRDGRLRGCCGFTGTKTTLLEGLQYSSQRTATEDPRMPPVSASELEFLDIEVWLLGGLLPVEAVGAAREQAIKVGRDGLLIQRGQLRGLLLPGVATDNGWSEEMFLRQICNKAKLPPSAWRESDTILQRFEGISVKGGFADLPRPTAAPSVVDQQSIESLANFCRENVQLISSGALPNYYLHEVDDGMVNGIVVSAKHSNGVQLNASKIAMRPPMPLQATLFGLCEDLVRSIQRLQLDANEFQVDVAILEDPAMQGTTNAPDLRGVNEQRCLFSLGPGQMWSMHFLPQQPAEHCLAKMKESLRLRPDQLAGLFSFRTHASCEMQVVNKPLPQRGPDVRPPGVAGKFYPATPAALGSMVRGIVSKLPQDVEKGKWRAAMIPHAGLQYSGRVAAEVLSRIDLPSTIIVIGPKHTRNGVDWAVAPNESWSLPGITLASDRQLAERLAEDIDHLQLDAAAHHSEHAIEVELPFIHHFAPVSRVVGIAVGSGNLEACRGFANGLAKTLKSLGEDVIVLISSDMNHFASDAETRRLDEIALKAIEGRDVEHIFKTVRSNEISMCGLLPAVITLDALNQLHPVQKAERVNYATSADVSGNTDRVVGYAGMLFN